MFHRRTGKQVVLNQDCVRVPAVQTPLAMIVRNVPDNHNMVCLLAGLAEVAIEHNARTRTRWLHSRLIAARNVESLNDHVVRSAKQYHPIGILRGPVNDNVSRFANCFEVNVCVVPGARFLLEHKPCVVARHNCNQVSSLCGISSSLQGFEGCEDFVQVWRNIDADP